ncbi:hypothetical protein BTO06_01305 [Tenacibaculum sp. SZ-18]|uniref:type II secretion system protein GspD n=1 Tax=Tenacibaculum sp. SZ-18 TaxID=754423 RepID=UPI000C2D4203|nr:secretin N-terminal domain-containing protein [Tenacibaculum sp. SZ-18]AUC13871.1 hypothetical protein BTO06_01305 [Tenacibaculum sp. SZ-18]
MSTVLFGQTKNERIVLLEKKLDSIATFIPALNEKVSNIDTDSLNIRTLLNQVTRDHKINFSDTPQLSNMKITYYFEEVTVKDLLIHICNKFNLQINMVGNILSLTDYEEPEQPKIEEELFVQYDKVNDLFSAEFNDDELWKALRRITEVTGTNLIPDETARQKKITGFIKDKPLNGAIEKLAFVNNFVITKTKDDYYIFQSKENNNSANGGSDMNNNSSLRVFRSSNFSYTVKDSINKILEVDFKNKEIGTIIKEFSKALNIDYYTTTDFKVTNTVTLKRREISFDELLTKILQDQDSLTYKKENGVYYFSEGDKKAVKTYEVIPLMHRSIEMMTTPSGIKQNDYDYSSLFGGSNNGNIGSTDGSIQNLSGSTTNGWGNDRNKGSTDYQTNPTYKTEEDNPFEGLKSFKDLIPEEFTNKDTKNFDIKTDPELNSFIVSGDPEKIKRFKKFIKGIDKPIPVILIEVMIIEVNKTATVDTGVELGLGDAPVEDSGTLFPSGNVTLGANTINNIIGGFNGFGSKNIGKVVPNFYAKIQALETNGNLKIRSTPKLSTLNGHKAVLSNGERTYYAVIRRDIIGSQNPQIREIKNYVPIDADLSISIRPMIAGDDQITMTINVLQSNFVNSLNNDDEAPPGINSREFNSIVRVKNQDIVILGGLEENLKSDSGSGVPFLARIPIIKWFFSKKTRVDSKKKLSVLIKPTIIR